MSAGQYMRPPSLSAQQADRLNDTDKTDHGYTHDLIIVGSGPAGMSAAITAVDAGMRVVVLDEQPRAGGQIYRNVATVSPRLRRLLGPDYRRGGGLVEEFTASAADVRYGATVWDISPDMTVMVQQNDRSFRLRAPQLIVASGAMERPSPIPGWTLPGVLNAGAAQIALKSSAQIPDGRVVLVGDGPLLLLVACQLVEAGAEVAGIVQTSPASNRRDALRHAAAAFGSPTLLAKGVRMLWQLRRAGVPFFKHATDARFDGTEDVDSQQSSGSRVKTVSFTSRGGTYRLSADVVLLHHGVVPNTQISRLMRVKHTWSDTQQAWHPVVDAWGETSLTGFRIAGDGASIGGALAAQACGAIAAIGAAAALGRLDQKQADELASTWRASLARHTRMRPFLDTLYRPPEWLTECPDETIVCRCEEVTAGRIREMARLGCEGPNQTKFFSRCGMGPCQGRMCGISVTQILAASLGRSPGDVGAYRIRAPLKPISLASIAALSED